jgi:hypothetical protein
MKHLDEVRRTSRIGRPGRAERKPKASHPQQQAPHPSCHES